MNFNQKPGIYKVNDDKLIINWDDSVKKNIFKQVNDILVTSSIFANIKIEEPFYIILPKDIKSITAWTFFRNPNLQGISGEGVEKLEDSIFLKCDLKEVYFPNLVEFSKESFDGCEEFLENHMDENGLIVLNKNILVDATNYTNNILNLSNFKSITTDAFYNSTFNTVILPIKLNSCKFVFNNEIKNVVLPIDFDVFDCERYSSETKIIYKGSERQLQNLIDKKELKNSYFDSLLEYKPYTFEELSKTNYSLKEIEFILDRKLTLDELLKLNYSLKEANEYFKESKEEDFSK